MAIIKSKKNLSGVHLHYHKNTTELETVKLPTPALVKIPMLQHLGAEAEPLVKAGDTVTVGQKIGDSPAKMCVPVHASVSGVVKEIGTCLTVGGKLTKTVVIEADGSQTLGSEISAPRVSSRQEFIAAVRESGIVGLGGAGFPTHVKLDYKNIDKVNTLIINGAECEPYITSDYRECIEHPEDIIEGIKLVMHWMGLAQCIIGIEKNKPGAIELLSKASDAVSGVSVMPLKTLYPQGAEKVLIYSATGKVVEEGMLPADLGVLVLNISTVAEIARYFKTGMPLINRRLTIDGDAVGRKQNLEVPVGTPVRDVLAYCGTDLEICKEILMGGPMMGIAVSDADMPIVKNNNAILAFRESQASYIKTTACIRCGKCIRVCPVNLMPASLERAYDNRNSEALEQLRVNLCINCGCCSYVCPAKRDLAAKNQLGKQLLKKEQPK